MNAKKPTRLSVNISQDTETVIRAVSDQQDVSATEALRRLVGYGILVYEADRNGGRVLLERDGRVERVVPLY